MVLSRSLSYFIVHESENEMLEKKSNQNQPCGKQFGDLFGDMSVCDSFVALDYIPYRLKHSYRDVG